MKKILLFIALFSITYEICYSQDLQRNQIDSLKQELESSKEDTIRVLILADLCFLYQYLPFDTVSEYSQRGLALARNLNFKKGEVRIMIAFSGALFLRGKLPESLALGFKSLQLAGDNNYDYEKAVCLITLGNAYWSWRDFDQALNYFVRAYDIGKEKQNTESWRYLEIWSKLNIGMTYTDLNQLDSAAKYLQSAYDETLNSSYWHPVLLMFYGDLLFKQGDHQTAFGYLRKSINIFEKSDENYGSADACRIMASFFEMINQPDSSIYYAKKGLLNSNKIDYKLGIYENSKLLVDQYRVKGNLKETNTYLELLLSVNDELYGAEKVQELQKTLAEEQERERQAEAKRTAYKNKIRQYGFLSGLGMLLIIAFILFRNNIHERKSKQQLGERNEIIEQTLENLKATQSQLIHSEKMASLGELTAGIAHEIQNPLNFVNNFSEVSNELVEELKAERLKVKENRDDHIEDEIINDVVQNLQKIKHHGERASEIVKSMLQHSRVSTGEKEMTDINVLCDEYLRLAYHGMRAKDKSFNAEYKLELDPALPKINVVPQDIGRVLLNLINNAFYAVAEAQRAKETAVSEARSSKTEAGSRDYKPEVTLITQQLNNSITIRVVDNGPGVAEQVRDKIFQPFFTTKPTGQGTGLGLSLSYDIVKAHGGELKVESKENEGTEFIIQLPV